MYAKPLHILLVDDHALVRAGLRLVLESVGYGIVVASEAGTAAEALEHAMDRVFDAAVIDVRMDGIDGIELTRMLRRLHPDLPVLGISMQLEEHLAAAMLEAGAAEVIQKTVHADRFCQAVRRVAATRLSRI